MGERVRKGGSGGGKVTCILCSELKKINVILGIFNGSNLTQGKLVLD